jgi:hypothetical protein
MDNSRGSSKRYTNEVDDSQLEHVKEIEAMAENETKTVGFWKFFVVATIVTTAAMVASGTYIFLNNENESNFEQSVSTTLNKPINTSLTINAPSIETLVSYTCTNALVVHFTVLFLCEYDPRCS